jgi:hypothetical protein
MLVGQLIREGNERPFGTVEVNGNIAYLGLYPSVQLDNDSIFIVNVTDPIHPEGIATYKLPNVENIGLGVTLDIQSKNSTLYVLTTMYLLTIDTRNPSNPTLLSSYKIPGERIEAESIHIQQDLAFITIRNNSTWKYSIIALNIKDRLHPQIVDIYQYQSGVRVTTFGRFAFIVSNDSLQSSNTIEIFDIIDPANPIKIATYDLGYFYSGAAIHKNLLFTGRDIYHITGLPKAYLPLVQH